MNGEPLNRKVGLMPSWVMTTIRPKAILMVGIAILLVGVAGCGTDTVVSPPAPDLSAVRTLLVIPFQNLSKIYGENVNARCPLTGEMFMTGPVPDAAPTMLTEHLRSFFQTHTDDALVPPEEAWRIYADIIPTPDAPAPGLPVLARSGREAGADIVVTGHLYRFSRRVGRTYAVQAPASVAFDVHLIQSETGRLLWSGHFDETQQSLSENLLTVETFLERGGQWVTAEQMARAGLDRVLKSLLP